MKLILRVWRQDDAEDEGRFETHQLEGVSEDSSFLEMMDQLNEQLLEQGTEPILFDHDCREGICGSCSLTINGLPHGPEDSTTTCQLHMRKFSDGDTVTIEPFRARAFPVVRDLVVDRSAFDRITQAGGYITVRTGSAPDGNALPVPKDDSDKAMDAAAEHAWHPARMPRLCSLPPQKPVTSTSFRRVRRKRTKEYWRWWKPWMNQDLVTAGIMVNVRLPAPRIFHWTTLRNLTAIMPRPRFARFSLRASFLQATLNMVATIPFLWMMFLYAKGKKASYLGWSIF